MSSTIPRQSPKGFLRVPELCADTALGIALLALAGWLSGARILAGEWGTYLPMAPSTALVFLLLSLALYCFVRWPRIQPSRMFGLAAAGFTFLIGLLVLGQFIAGVDLGIEQLLLRTNEFLGPAPLGRMSPLTAVAFLLESLGLLFLIMQGWRRARGSAALLAAGATAISAVVLIGYAYDAPLLYGGTIIPMALPTAVAFVLLGVGQLYLAVPGIRALQAWGHTSMQGMLLRAFLPFMLLFVLLDGWLDSRLESVLAVNPALWNSSKSVVAGVLIVILTGWIARRSGSELDRAQQTLAESEELFRTVFENSPLGKSLTGVDGSMKVNQAFCDIVGYTEEELRAGSWRNITHPDDLQKSLDANRDLLEGKIARAHFEKRYIRKDGSLIWTDLITALQRDGSGQPLHFITTINDITERKKSEEALRAASGYNRRLLEASIDPLVTIGPDGRITDVNEATVQVSGIAREALIGTDFSNYFTEPAQARAGYQAVFEKGFVTDYPLTIRRSDGKLTDVLYNASVYRDTDGNVLGIFAAARDMTEIMQAQQALHEREDKWRRLFAILPVGVSVLDAGRAMTDRNPALERIIEMPGEGFQAKAYDKRTYIRADGTPMPSDELPSVRAVQEQRAIEHVEIGVVTGEGPVKWTEVSAAPLPNPDGGVVVVTTDISERKRTEAELRGLQAELEERVIQRTEQLDAANKELEAFAYSVSHDLRAPLRAISGFTNILVEDYGSALDAEGQRVCGVISNEAQRMGQLIDDLLGFSRLSRAMMRNADIDMKALVQSVFNELTTPESLQRIDFRLGPLAPAQGDPALIRQVWANLLSNALKFTAKMEKAVISVESTPDHTDTVYSVRDNGAGFDMRYADKLFGVFQRLHSETEFEGTGVGLAIVQRVILRHGGRVWGEGQVGGGAVFSFALPRRGRTNE